ncbi:peptidylprolyl isomerase [Paenibacillus beijingensis]|uniref:PpiC domain-containing protein n=1 Tax=Paenibacillus beijingensis TaxID=1126833 RepID=A0A0D5NIH8_9BACL|nr:peptidylprolyl isomerase [Paenibacillus beijingensis]AJY74925.1 hypothetical protein VN24_10415 [Paenibacillus beijingensis]
MLHNKERSVWRVSLLLLLTAALMLTAAACGKKDDSAAFSGAGKGTVIATYKDGEVTDKEFDNFLNVFGLINAQYASVITIPQYKDELLKQYIGYKILYDRASGDAKKKAKTEADTQYKSFAQSTVGEQTAAAAMKAKNISESDAKAFFNLVMTVSEGMNEKVTDDKLKKQFDSSKNDFTVVTVRHVLVAMNDAQTGKELRKKEAALARAQDVKKLLAADDTEANWKKIAAEYSDDPGSKEQGGQYADQAVGNWVAAFKKAALEQKVGVIGDPVETEYGYHVIKVEKREPVTYDKLSENQTGELKNSVVNNEMTTFMEKELPTLITKQTKFADEQPKSGGNGTDDKAKEDGGSADKKEDGSSK